jgi:lysine-N-methylase
MSMPLRHLPVVQNWDCHSCCNCCREYDIPITEEERRRILAQGWEKEEALGGLPLFVRQGRWWRRRYRLNRQDRGCIFLSENNRCRLHERFGAGAKPLACRLFPFVLVPGDDHWRVSLRFACPSVAANRGRPLHHHRLELERLAAVLEKQEGLEGKTILPPALQGKQRVAWSDLHRFVQTLLSLLRNREDRLERRWRKCLALAQLCRQARFDAISGQRLSEFLHVVTSSLEGEVPVDPKLPRPSWIGRILFRQTLAVYARKDRGENRGLAAEGRLALLRAGCRFALGRGRVPRLNALLPETTFEQVEAAGALPIGVDEILERYYQVKVGSLQFCGAANFGLSFWDGLESLALTLPVILWMARAFADQPAEQATLQAVSLVDDHFGYNSVLADGRQRFALRILARRGELEKLIGWYSR